LHTIPLLRCRKAKRNASTKQPDHPKASAMLEPMRNLLVCQEKMALASLRLDGMVCAR
jgi:hypothetical protein